MNPLAVLLIAVLAPTQTDTSHAHDHALPGTGSSLNPAAAWVQELNPRIALHTNALFRLDDRRVETEDGDPIDDRFNLREVEFEFRADVAGLAEGVVILTSEAEAPGEYDTAVEEAYLSVRRFFDRPPGPIEIRAGRFRPEFGRFNLLHTHQLPQTVRPRSFSNFFGEEGFKQDGAELAVAVGGRDTGQRARVSAALVNGGGLPVGEDNDGENIAYLVHAELTTDLAPGHSVGLGASTWQGKNDARGAHATQLYGVDGTYEWRAHGAGRPALLKISGEGYYARVDNAGRSDDTPVGGFAYVEVATGDRTSIGALIDFVESLEDDRSETTTGAIYANWRLAESLGLRVGVDRVLQSDDPELNHLDTVFFELNFTIGTHRH